MANPTVVSVEFQPPKPAGGYLPGQTVDMIVKYADADSTPAVPARSATFTFAIQDLSGNPGVKTETVQFAAVPEKIDLNLVTASVKSDDGTTFSRMSVTKDTITWRFVA